MLKQQPLEHLLFHINKLYTKYGYILQQKVEIKAFCNISSVWGSLVKLYPFVALINQSLITIYYNNSGKLKVLFPATKLISKSDKVLGTRLTFNKIKKP